MNELPKGWTCATIDDLLAPSSDSLADGPYGSKLKSDHYTDSGAHVIRLGNIGKGKYIRSSRVYIDLDYFEKLSKHHVAEGDLVIAALGDPLGRCCEVPNDILPALVKADCFRVRLGMGVDKKFFVSWMNSEAASQALSEEAHGVGRLRINMTDLRGLKLPLPPIAEQNRIFAKLDALSAKSARARTELARIEALVSRYKHAVLNAAFSGNLKIRELGEVVSRIKAGKNLRCEERPPRPEEIGVVKVSAVTWGEFRPEQSKTLPADFEPDADTRVRDGDFLFSRANTVELVGAVVIVASTPKNLYLSDKILRIEFRETIDRWVLWYLRSPAGRAALMNASSGNQLSMRNIGQKSLLSMHIPYTDRTSRDKIVRRIESAFARIDRLAAEAKRALDLLGKLDEAILANAFRGELVPQDENDEPADVLLDRIRAERARAPKAKRGGRAAAARS